MTRYPVIDADAHILERASDLVENLEGPWARTGTRRSVIPNDSWDRSMGGKHGKEVYDLETRLKDMDEEGIELAVLYPTAGLNIGLIREPEYAAAVCRAYNNFMGKLCAATPRAKAVALLPAQNPAEAVKELNRAVTKLNLVGGLLTCQGHGKNLGTPEFYPLYEEAQRLDVPISIHPNATGAEGVSRFDRFISVHALGFTLELMIQTTAVIFGGIPELFPELRIAFLEAGIGWVPYWMERLDEHWEKRGSEAPNCKAKPSEYMTSGRIYYTFEAEEELLPMALDHLPAECLLYASDYPHWDYEPGSADTVRERSDISEEVKHKIFIENPKRFYCM